MFPIRDHNPSSTTPIVTWLLIALNVGIQVWQAATIQTEAQLYYLYDAYAMIPAEISAGRDLVTLVTSTFLHGGWMHLIGNMLFLYIFGDNLEEALGRLGFLAFYLLGGIGAGLCQWASGPMSAIPTVGASGAIAAVMGGYLLLFPKAKVDVLVFIVIIIRIIPVPAWIMLALWLVVQVFSGLGADPLTGGVAYWAHAGGFLIGFVMMVPAWVRRGGAGWWTRTDGRPPHPDAAWGQLTPSRIPTIRRRR
ncbi:rhomboid family intramembrane serine protease [Rubellimicrobium rubrum]|uniref:Rhomboid family intramembrane serine protease n=1 Tax=Rubellimicrobium rubrum TaxID=2585369 RepID=A0A5C4N336_9RHOB|nr:rhomboid family intramembrane serine protease [Rubellimicrobium rubrum]TNC51837.1 rhomboid family intramembrane serine protease [Rubellimicrobium rubrum]